MNTIIIEPEAYDYLSDWVDDYKILLYDNVDYFKKCCLVFVAVGTKETLKLYVKKLHKENSLKFTLNTNRIIAKGYISREKSPTGDDCSLTFSITDDSEDPNKIVDLIRIACTSYIHANLFLLYGNFVRREERQLNADSRNNENGDKTIVFRPYRDTLYAAEVGTHRSPEGVFEVRGHFRHYEKTGKVIWIEPYLKGTQDKE